MKQQILFALPLLGAVMAHPTASMKKRSVPREHAHEDILRKVDALLALNNPDNIQAAVFGFLGAAAASEGAGNIADTDCLQQATADQAFTNAKELGDIDGMTDALIFRAIERNTGSVGLESALCESIVAVNPEIAALQQHQDAAADGAQELNKLIAAELARQIASIGGDPLRANEASTFAPGEIGDPTANGGGCNDENDPDGCINTLGLRVDDLSEEEILAAVEDLVANEDELLVDDEVDAVLAPECKVQKVKKVKKVKQAKQAKQAKQVEQVQQNVACNAAIVFGAPSDGRQQDAFEPADLSLFNHGSALNIAVISNFICSQISNRCDVSDSIIANCEAAAAAANGLLGQAAADAFNSLLGF